ncbi:hypothetical protein LCM10_10880 [Rossellomorea aquimaris]|uniref:esterase/lipase family protein n=1 Tax=Rossellomorea aquimaris TaxID=189382 RepID=UPI001CD1BFD3|nr:hypothetical protein [Rossellomorea aquimaris]MCA1055488.1 hypothetical protein [Rossellomorea aquimaris]
MKNFRNSSSNLAPKGTRDLEPGTWNSGPRPDEVLDGSDPILFIHGINTNSDTWRIAGHDIGELACSHGFQTAFINLSGSSDMWANGLLLAEKMKEISDYFKKKLVIVAHSKGGIDAQTAMVHHGASPYVRRAITLSTPHHGAELADLAYSKWASWLTEKINSKSDAIFSLQTAYMKAFRERTDHLDASLHTPFYTFGGTGWGGMGSELFWGGLYLSRFGPNDGAVTVKSSRLPYGKKMVARDWTHKTIKQGEEIFPYIKGLLLEDVEEPPFASITLEAGESGTSVLHRGGEYTGKGEEWFWVEDGVDELTIDWINSLDDTALTLTDPGGNKHMGFSIGMDETGFFPGAFHHSLKIVHPSAGRWLLEARNDRTDMYLLNLLFKDGVNPRLEDLFKGKDDSIGKMDDTKKVHTNVHVMHIPEKEPKRTQAIKNPDSLNQEDLAAYEEGIHNITIDINGVTAQGHKYERTVIKTIFVKSDGTILE